VILSNPDKVGFYASLTDKSVPAGKTKGFSRGNESHVPLGSNPRHEAGSGRATPQKLYTPRGNFSYVPLGSNPNHEEARATPSKKMMESHSFHRLDQIPLGSAYEIKQQDESPIKRPSGKKTNREKNMSFVPLGSK
jgi:hypothetical protein